MAFEIRQEQLEAEVEELRARLQEAEETLSAIRSGEVDALVVTEKLGERVYTLRSPDQTWRLMVEEMRQGAITTTTDGLFLWCNAGFARMLRTPAEALVGVPFRSFVAPESRELVEALLSRAESGEGEVTLLTANGTQVPAYLAVRALPLEEVVVLCLVVTDLTEQKRNEQIMADERLARSILEHAAEAQVVCDPQGRILRASGEAHRLRGRNVLLEPFGAAFPLETSDPEIPDAEAFLSRVLAGWRLRGVEAVLDGPGGRLDLLLSAGPLWGTERQVEGCVVTLTDITARRRAEKEVEKAWEAAEAMNEAKDRFLATLSHELRTPLTPVLAVLSSMESKVTEPQGRIAADLAMMRRNIELEARLIDDLLDLTRISSGKIDLQRGVTDLREVVEHAVRTSCGEAIAAGRVQVMTELPEGNWQLWADSSRLTQVFWNLLNNAVKFTPEGGTIRVHMSREDTPPCLIVEMADTGAGIEPDLLPRIFNAFEQGAPGGTRRSGLGLGLAISKTIVDLHGGELSVRSAGKGQGATFTVCLPVVPPPAGQPAEPDGEASEPAPEPVLPRHILLVEDHADTAEALTDLLRDRGYQVSTAGSIAQALELARPQEGVQIDLVVSDLGLPDGNGLDLMRELSGRYGLSGIALSGYGMEEDVRKSHEAGFRKHLTKPVDLRALEEAIRGS
jgi:two-component system, chemotaxis family, CheB/CheR fusion protein